MPILTQLCKLIPSHPNASLARKHGIDKQARTFSAWSHVVSLIFAQLTHATGLNDVCDALRNHSRWLGSLRGATAPPRNTLSHANKTRESAMMEELFWQTLRHPENSLPGGFVLGHSKEAIRWQLWAALLLYVLMRWQGQAAGWAHSFSRLLAVVRGVVWDRIDLAALLRSYGTAGGGWRMRSCCEGTYLPGFSP